MTTASRWAKQYRFTKDGPWTFKYHPWSEGMHNSKADMNVGKKSAQMAYSETVLNVTLFMMDVMKTDCLYVLPNKHPDAADFSSGRFDKAIQESPHLQTMFSDVKNVGHKKVGSASLYIRGSRSESGLMSLPVGMIVLDELNQMTEANVPIALQRTAGQKSQLVWMVSTPTRDGKGISTYYEDSTKEHFFFECPSCSRWIELTFPESLVITAENSNEESVKDSHLICTKCKNRLNNANKWEWLAKGEWHRTGNVADKRGFYINQLYACTVKTPVVLAMEYLDSRYNQAKEQTFYNSSMGLDHITKGAQLIDAEIENVIGSHKNKIEITPDGLLTMGVDVNHPYCNYSICRWTLPAKQSGADIHEEATCTVLESGEVRDFSELEELHKLHKINFTVVDAQPDRRCSELLTKTLFGQCAACFYNAPEAGQVISEKGVYINVHRTTWMDIIMTRFKKKTIVLPAKLAEGFREHCKAPARIFRADQYGNMIARYETKDGVGDHYFHSLVYAEIAFSIAAGYTPSVGMKSPL